MDFSATCLRGFVRQQIACQWVDLVTLLWLIAVATVEDTSDMQCESLLQPGLLALPQSPDQLATILFAQPTCHIPIQKDVFDSFGANSTLRRMFVVDDGSAAKLARIVSTQLTFKLWLGGEPDTMHNVNQGLIVPLQELDSLAPESHQGFLPVRDKGDPDSTMTLLSEKSASLRPDGVIRSNDDCRLLMKWEEKADSLIGAVEDLRGDALLVCLKVFCHLCHDIPKAFHGRCAVCIMT